MVVLELVGEQRCLAVRTILLLPRRDHLALVQSCPSRKGSWLYVRRPFGVVLLEGHDPQACGLSLRVPSTSNTLARPATTALEPSSPCVGVNLDDGRLEVLPMVGQLQQPVMIAKPVSLVRHSYEGDTPTLRHQSIDHRYFHPEVHQAACEGCPKRLHPLRSTRADRSKNSASKFRAVC